MSIVYFISVDNANLKLEYIYSILFHIMYVRFVNGIEWKTCAK